MKLGSILSNWIKMHKTISKKQLRQFGFLIGFGFPCLIGWLIPMLIGQEFKTWTLLIGIIGLTLGSFVPKSLNYPYRLWMSFGFIAGWLNSRIILGLVFFLVLQPTSYLMRVFGHDPLRKKRKGKISYREWSKKKITDLTRIF